jgi:hypothetical protein
LGCIEECRESLHHRSSSGFFVIFRGEAIVNGGIASGLFCLGLYFFPSPQLRKRALRPPPLAADGVAGTSAGSYTALKAPPEGIKGFLV